MKSPSELLMKALEDFGESEPTSLMLIYTNQADECVIMSSERRTACLGLIEAAKHMILFCEGGEQ